MNTRLLNQVANAILREPLKFDISTWVDEDDKSPCGTTACIAGHAVALSRGYQNLKPLFQLDKRDLIQVFAQEKLGLTEAQSYRLFQRGLWPEEFADRSRAAKDREEAADIAFWRIQAFIATEGAV